MLEFESGDGEEMYEYSLSSYLGVFDTALRDAKPDKIVDNRLKTPGSGKMRFRVGHGHSSGILR